MGYTIGEVARRFNLPVSTLRYYDKEGLFPDLERKSGIRRFSEQELETLRVIECLKKSGLEIKDIRRFMQWCSEGPATYSQRRQLFVDQRAKVEEEMSRMQKVHDMLSFKCWYYSQLLEGADAATLHDPTSDKMPPEIKKAYRNVFSED